jgi:hypothetical protein
VAAISKHQYAINNHKIERFVFANASERAAGTPNGITDPITGDDYTLVTDDIGQIAYQQDNGTYWRLTGVGPLSWLQITGTGSGTATGAAGGVLSGTYPNPGFAVDMATQAELDAETSARASGDAAVQANLNAHLTDTTDAHDAAAISFDDATASLGETDVQGAIEALDSRLDTFESAGVPPSGAAGGDLTGTYPDPTIAANAVTTAKIADATVTDGKLATSYIKADGTRPFTGDQSLGTHKLTNVGDPASAQDAATKAYVDGLVEDLSGVSDAATARTNLGLGSAATHPSTDFAAASHTHDGGDIVSGTVAAARLGVMTGDSGSGGAGGAVPAPAAGDAAAGKFLAASGDWAVPAVAPGSVTPGSNGQLLKTLSGAAVWADDIRSLTLGFDGGGATLSSSANMEIVVPFACTILGWTLVADQSGTLVLDVLRSTYAEYPTMSSLCGGSKPSLSSAQKNTDSTVSGWTTALAANDILRLHVDSVTSIQRCTLMLKVKRTD